MKRDFKVPTDTVVKQRRAADPDLSAWVDANAGSGKTHVLTQRVLRLLLAGVAPEAILCLTYTKAAAAEMRGRVSAALGDWAILDDAGLDTRLAALGQAGTPALRARARTLFARALETPGGLKIVTIHAFCESVLHRFPLEAGVPFDFRVVEDVERNAMILDAREAVLAGGLRGAGEAQAVEALFGLMTDFAISEAIDIALAESRKLKPVLADRARAKANLRKRVGYSGRGIAEIEAEMLSGRLIDAAGFEVIQRICGKGDAADELQTWLGTFLTKDLAVRARFPPKALETSDSALAAQALAEAQRLETLCTERRTAELVARSEALLDVLGAIAGRYEADKRARSLLDFDDLIEKLAALLGEESYQLWVQYKLDAGIHHILVDESQDTNPEQWRVVDALAREFFTGEGQVSRPRTLFSVGDPKQSIYSFQGAEPRLFAEAGRDYRRRADEAGKAFDAIKLHTSFRTLRPILEAVDLVCARGDIQRALLEEQKVHHDTARAEPGGSVTLWPPVQQAKVPLPKDEWPMAPLETAEQSAPRQIATRIAREIRGWIARGRRLADGSAMTADDVMVLVQSRSQLFHEIIRALIAEGLPTPGADRLEVTTHIAIMDLMALADVLLNTADDLQLAAVLRSPLFDVGEDDLFAIAHGRKASLWEALARADLPSARAAYARLVRWRSRLDFDRPYEFYANILYAEGGLEQFHARLGGEVDDLFGEFLALALEHEQNEQPSLSGFLAAMRRQDVSIKRDLAEHGGGVRVMTVHGAKGLEAPIVILADAATKPNGKQTTKPVLIFGEPPVGPLFIHAPGKADHVPATQTLSQQVKDRLGEEYWRKLYVGMTRAEEALYVTGALTPGTTRESQVKDTWYEAMEMGLRAHCRIETDGEGNETALIYPGEAEMDAEGITAGRDAFPKFEPLVLPDLPPPPTRPVVRPSSAYEASRGETALTTTTEAVRGAEEARRSGIALHALLQHLVGVPREDRQEVAAKAMPVLLPDHPHLHEALAGKAISIFSRPELAHLFGPGSRAEVPFLIAAKRGGKPVRIAGRIDRLVVDDANVLVVDYKSDATLPGGPEAVPGNYRTQLGLYALVAGQLFPERKVQTAILWTSLESLMNLPAPLLAEATADFTLK